MKKLLLFLLLIPALAKAQWGPNKTLTWQFPATQTGVKDSAKVTYAGQLAPQFWWSSAQIRYYINSKQSSADKNYTDSLFNVLYNNTNNFNGINNFNSTVSFNNDVILNNSATISPVSLAGTFTPFLFWNSTDSKISSSGGLAYYDGSRISWNMGHQFNSGAIFNSGSFDFNNSFNFNNGNDFSALNDNNVLVFSPSNGNRVGYIPQSSFVTASNGLTKTGTDIQLGGDLSSDVVINTGNATNFFLGNHNSFTSFLQVNPVYGTVNAFASDPATNGSSSSFNMNNTSGVILAATNSINHQSSIKIDTTGLFVNDWHNIGLQNADNYHASYATHPHALTDVSYVDSIASKHASISQDSLNYFYNRSTWSEFGDFVAQGSYTIVDGKIQAPVSNTTDLSLVPSTGLDAYTLTVTYRANNGSSSSTGLPLGIKSTNTSQTTASFAIFFDEVNKKIGTIYYGSGGTTTLGSSVLSAYVSGDLLKLTIVSVAFGYNVTLQDITQNQQITYVVQSPYDNPAVPKVINTTGRPTIYGANSAVSYDISGFSYSTPYKYGGSLYFVDSNGRGNFATSANGRYAIQLGGQIDGSPADRSTEGLLHFAEAERIRPSVVYLNLGTNDAAGFSTWKTNYVALVAQFDAAGIKTIKLCPPPTSAVDMSVYKNYILSTWPESSIDTYTPFVGTGYHPNPAYFVSDSVHYNQAGHNLMAATISSSPLYQTYSYSNVVDKSVVTTTLAPTGVVAGFYPAPFDARFNEKGQAVTLFKRDISPAGALLYNNAGSISPLGSAIYNGTRLTIGYPVTFNPTISTSAGSAIVNNFTPTVTQTANGDKITNAKFQSSISLGGFTNGADIAASFIASGGTSGFDFASYLSNTAYYAIYPTGVTQSASNYVFRADNTGANTILNAGTTLRMRANNSDIITVTAGLAAITGNASISSFVNQGGLVYVGTSGGQLAATGTLTSGALIKSGGTGAPSAATANTDYLPVSSPAMTGTPTAPTAAAATNTTQVATTAHVFAERTNTATLTNKTLTTPKLTGYTVATLPAGTVGMMAYVTDALTPASLAIVVGGGSSVVPVFYNGSNWIVL